MRRAHAWRQAFRLGLASGFSLAFNIEIAFAAGTGGVSEIGCRRQTPLAGGVHQKRMLAGMIVAIMGEYTEEHPPKGVFNILSVARNRARCAKERVVA